MKTKLSVFMLLCRSTLGKLLLLLPLMAAAELLAFYFAMQNEFPSFVHGVTEAVSLEHAFAQGKISWIAAAGLLLMTVVLCLCGCEFGSKVGYTLRRLSLSEKDVFVCQAVHNTLCYLLFWTAQILLTLVMSIFFTNLAPEGSVSVQTVFLAYCRSPFLHSLLPLMDISLWIRNIIIAAGLGIACAVFPFRQREGTFGGEIAALFMVVLVWFSREIDELGMDILVYLCFAVVTAEALYHIYAKREIFE